MASKMLPMHPERPLQEPQDCKEFDFVPNYFYVTCEMLEA